MLIFKHIFAFMKMQTPSALRILFPSLLWEVKTSGKEIFLTFDDGPHPEITPKVLNILAQFKAKASFFCVGENINKYPDIFRQIKAEGHSPGNHSYNHLNGWKTKNSDYFENIEKCGKLTDSSFFRPPYGKLKPSQIAFLKKKYRIVMWSALSYDFDKSVKPEQCLRTAIKNTRRGTIMVFHDSEKAAKNMLYALPRYLEHFSNLGYLFKKLEAGM